MKGDFLYAPAAIAAVICGLWGQAGAQALVTHRIPAALALEAVAAAVETCGKQGYAETAIVVDADGVTQALLRGDWTGVHSIDSATYKAYTSATMKVDTSVLIEREKTDPMGPGMAKLPPPGGRRRCRHKSGGRGGRRHRGFRSARQPARRELREGRARQDPGPPEVA